MTRRSCRYAFSSLVLLSLTAFCVTNLGCTKPDAAIDKATGPPTSSSTMPAESSDTAPQDATETPDDVKPSESETKPAESEPKADQAKADGADDEGKPAADSGAAAKPAKLKTERIVLFTLQGPLIVEVVLSIDGAPHDQALAKLVEYVLEAADTNNDGRPTWDELTNSPKFIYGQLGNAAFNTAEMKRNAINLYDVTKNGRVDASEVPRFLTRNAGGSRSFDFRSANYYRDINRGDSPLFGLLDYDEDGRINQEEAARAETRLTSRDADSDGVLFSDEVANSAEERPGPLTQRRVSAGAASAWLGGKPKWTNILYAMEEQYMLGGSLKKSAFKLTPDLFDLLDANDDERIVSNELAAIATVEPHVRIESHFGERAEDAESPRLNLTMLHDDLRDSASFDVGTDRITIQLPKDRILIFLKDQAQSGQAEQQAIALLAQYDTDKNDYLDEDEFPDQAPVLQGGLEAYDTDDDGKVFKAEIVEYLANAGVAQRSQIRSRAGDQTDAFFDALDGNRDGRLDGREIYAIPERIKQLDRDNDGELIVDEIPGSMALAIVRGNPQQADALFAIPVSRPAPPENAPRWFLRMDRNQDGAIARNEFLGEQQQFAALDANEDGFVAVDEVESEDEEAGE